MISYSTIQPILSYTNCYNMDTYLDTLATFSNQVFVLDLRVANAILEHCTNKYTYRLICIIYLPLFNIC